MAYIVPLVGAGVVAGIGVTWWVRWRAVARARARVVVAVPPPAVRLLRSDDELREAADRAARFDDDVWSRLRQRADRYQALAAQGGRELVALPAHGPAPGATGRPPVPADGTPRTA